MQRTFTPDTSVTLLRLARIVGPVLFAGLFQPLFAGKNFGIAILGDAVAAAFVIGLVILYGWMHSRNTRIEAGPRALRIRNFLGLTYSVAPFHLAKTVFVSGIVPIRNGNRRNLGPRLYVLDDAGRAVLLWTESVWTATQMGELSECLDLPRDSIAEPVSLNELRARYPRALRFGELHPYALAVIILGGLIVIGGGVVAAMVITAPA